MRAVILALWYYDIKLITKEDISSCISREKMMLIKKKGDHT